MKPSRRCLLFLLAVQTVVSCSARAGPPPSDQSSRLYTPLDPRKAGGISGRLDVESTKPTAVLAVNTYNHRLVYNGQLTDDAHGFLIQGLPVGKYDLVIASRTRLAEGLALTHRQAELTEEQRQEIAKTIRAATPFFDDKTIYRVVSSGPGSHKACALIQELRRGSNIAHPGTKYSRGKRPRSVKIIHLTHVGSVGWEIASARELLRDGVPEHDPLDFLKHTYNEKLRGIRVTDSTKDVGTLKPW